MCHQRELDVTAAECVRVSVSYLTSVLGCRVVHLPAVHRKLLLVQEGKQRLQEGDTGQV